MWNCSMTVDIVIFIVVVVVCFYSLLVLPLMLIICVLLHLYTHCGIDYWCTPRTTERCYWFYLTVVVVIFYFRVFFLVFISTLCGRYIFLLCLISRCCCHCRFFEIEMTVHSCCWCTNHHFDNNLKCWHTPTYTRIPNTNILRSDTKSTQRAAISHIIWLNVSYGNVRSVWFVANSR